MTRVLHLLRRRGSSPDSQVSGPSLVLVLPFVAFFAGCAGLSAWAIGHLTEPPRPARPAPPPRVVVASVRLDDWPEIKDGVPQIKRAAPALPAALRPVRAPETGPAPEATAGVEPAGPRETGDERASASSIREPGPAAVPSAPEPGAPSKIEGAAPQASPGDEAASEPGAPRQAAAEAPAALPPPASPPPSEPRRDAAEVSRGRTQASVRQPAPQRDAAKVARKAEAKPARPERKRVAAAAPVAEEPAVASPGPESEPKDPDDDRVKVLGVSLPSGRKIKECLIELRC